MGKIKLGYVYRLAFLWLSVVYAVNAPKAASGAADSPGYITRPTSLPVLALAGNRGTTQALAVTVDNTPPVTEMAPGAPGYPRADGGFTATAATVFTLTAKDPLSGVAMTEYNVDYGAWQPYAPFTIAAEGRHTVNFKSTDTLGNEEAVRSVDVVIDNTPPITGITAGAPHHIGPADTLYAAAATVFTLNAVDGEAGAAKTEYRIDGGPWAPYAPFRIDAEGKHLIEYRSADRLGNMEAERALTAIIDKTPPATSVSLGTEKIEAGGVIFTGKRSAFTLDATDSLSGVKSTEYRIDRGRWVPYAPFSIAPRRSHAVSFRSRDNVGNLEEAKTITVILDKTPPKTTIDVSAPKIASAKGALRVTDRTTFTLNSTDGESGSAGTEYRIDGGPWTTYLPFTIPGEGKHLIEYRSVDRVGNLEAPRSLRAVVDTTPPVTTVHMGKQKYSAGSVLYADSKSNFTLKATNNRWGWDKTEYRVDGGPWTNYASPFTVSDEGRHLIEYRSADRGGNQETVRSFTAVVDNTPPVSTVIIGTPKREADGVVYINSSTVLTPAATDNLAGVARTEYRLADKGVEGDPMPFSIAVEGKFQIEYWSTDRVGNREAPRTLTVVVNNSLPVINTPDSKPLGEKGEADESLHPVSAPNDSAPVKAGAAIDMGDNATVTDRAVQAGAGQERIAGAADSAAWKPSEAAVGVKQGGGSEAIHSQARLTAAGYAAYGEADTVPPVKEKSRFFEYLTLGIVQLVLVVGIMLL